MNKRVIDLEGEKALKERVAYHSVVVTSTDKDFQHGTGILLTHNGRVFVITCLHTVKNISPSKLRFIPRCRSALIDTKKEKIKEDFFKKSITHTAQIELPIEKIHESSDIIDLAAIELRKEIKRGDLEFFKLENGTIMVPKAGFEYIMMGFPGEIAIPVKNRMTGKIGNVAFLHTDWPEIVEFKDSLGDFPKFDPRMHFLMKVPCSDQEVSLYGMSGSGIWTWKKAVKDKLWVPELKLVGIQNSCYTPSKLLKATKVDCLLNLLSI